MADAAELEFLRRTLVEPGLLAPDRLDAWRLGWSGRGSFFAHLVELGALARADAGTLGAVFKGYVRMPPASLLMLFKRDAQAAGDAVGPVAPAERQDAPVPEDIPTIREAGSARPARRELRGADVEGLRSTNAEAAARSSAGLRRADAESAGRSSPALRGAVTAAIDAALSGLPMEAAEELPARAPVDFEDMSRGTGDDQI